MNCTRVALAGLVSCLAAAVGVVPTQAVPLQTVSDPVTGSQRGSAPMGSTAYQVPSNAVFVAPWGSDSGSGRIDQPMRTVARAASTAPAGGTVVVRGGVYHQSVEMPYYHPVTVQSYPGEAVWFDGARTVDGWVQDGSAWRVDNWTVELDSSPTYTRGAPDATSENMSFVRPDHPMAAYPDQLWIDGVELTQVGSRAEVQPGTFFVDKRNDKLYSGTNPIGRRAEASDLVRAFTLQSPGTVLRGIGIRRYAPSVPDQGAVNTYWSNMTLENVTISDSSTAGLGVYAPNTTLRNVTVDGSGQLGLGASHADNLVMDNVAVTRSNDEWFNMAPTAGGIKVTKSRNVTLKNSLVSDNIGTGFWVDDSVYGAYATNNILRNNAGNGIYYEISEKGTIEGNTITGSGDFGVTIYDTGNVRVRNNVIISKGEALNINQDARRPENYPWAVDDRAYNPDMTWQVRNLDIQDNLLAGGKSSWNPATALVRIYGGGLLDVRASSDRNIVLNNNRYGWTGERPTALIWYSIAGDRFTEFADLTEVARLGGQEVNGVVVGRVSAQ